nr:PDZ domain-containing protein [Mesobacillus harenae]
MLFLHPLFYFLFFIAAVLGVMRVKRERRNFHLRVEDAYFELRQLIPLGAVIGLGVSLVVLSAGLTVPVAVVILTAVVTFLWSLTTKIRLLSPAYTVGAAFFALIFISSRDFSLPVFNQEFSAIDEKVYPSLAIVLALLIIGEGIFILLNGHKATSPKLIKSKRGLPVGVHESRRMWMLPVFLLVPGEVLTAPFEWWPVFSIGAQTYGLLLFPFAVGFHQQIQGLLPKLAVRMVGRKVVWLGVLILFLAAGGYWYPVISIGAVALAVIGREFITQRQRIREENLPFYFSNRDHGLMILGVMPNSPASKMGLKAGELITKVNGVKIRDEKPFYEALQRNRAHCKLEVLDTNDQIRFVQRALYEGDHHELGILFIHEGKGRKNQAV